MKRKLSTKLFAAFLAVLMILTSAPISALAQFNDADADKASLVSQATTQMEAFENMFDANGTSYKNVSQAYTKFVALQKALDSYQYGKGTAASLQNAIGELNTAMGLMVEYNPATVVGTAVPTFKNCAATSGNMLDYAGTAYSSVLYAPEATVQVDSDAPGGLRHEVIYASNAVLLYNGTTPLILPVMFGGYRSADGEGYDASKKSRSLRACFPATSNDGGADDANWGFEGVWNSGNGNDMNWSWNWWKGASDNSGSHASYNAATGKKGLATAYSSASIPTGGIDKSGLFNPTYKHNSSLKHLYMSNALKFKGTSVADYGQSYTLNWYASGGGDNDNDTSYGTASTPIRVVNYTTLSNAITSAAAALRGTELLDFSEGGLATYFSTMDSVKNWDPTTYFANNTVDGYANCIAAMQNLVQQDIAALPTEATAGSLKDSTKYQALRDAMDQRSANYNKGVNKDNYWDADSFAGFCALYTQAMQVMDNVVSNNYGQADLAKSLADQILEYEIEPAPAEIPKVDAADLVTVIQAYNKFDKSLFVSTTTVQSMINVAITDVWQGAAFNSEPDLIDADEDGVNQGKVDTYVTNIIAAIKALKINPNANILTSEGSWNLNDAVALNSNPNNIKGRPSTDYANYGTFNSYVNYVTTENGYMSELSSQDLISGTVANVYSDYETKVNAYKTAVTNIVESYEALALSFFVIENGAIAKSSPVEVYSVEKKFSKNIDREHYIGFRVPTQNNVILRRNHEAGELVYGDAEILFGTTVNGNPKRGNYLDGFVINADAYTEPTNREICSDSGDDLPAQKNDVFNYQASLVADDIIGVKNFKVVGRTDYYDAISNSNYGYYAYGLNGELITDPNSDQYDAILGETTGLAIKGGVFAHSTTDKHFGTVTLGGDVYVKVAATTPKVANPNQYMSKADILSAYPGANLIPEPEAKSASHTFGALCGWSADYIGTKYAGFAFIKSSDTYTTGVTIVDLADYFDFVNLCELLVQHDSDRYTDTTLGALTDAIGVAKSYDYLDKDSSTIRRDLNFKYQALYAKLVALEEKTFVVTFITKDGNGNDVTSTIELAYNDTVANHNAEYTQKVKTDVTYVQDNKTWSFSHFTPSFDKNAVVKANATYTAVYEGTWNYVDFDQYEIALDAIKDLDLEINDYKYTVTDLQAVAQVLSTCQYLDMPADLLATDENVAAVEAERQVLANLLPLTVAGVSDDYKDVSYAAQRVYEQASEDQKDIDRYELVPDFEVFDTVTLMDGVTVIGWNYVDDAAIETEISQFLNGLALNTYNVYLNGSKVIENIDYGTAVIVDSDGNYTTNVNDDDINNYAKDNVSWTYSFNAPSRNSATPTTPKYYFTAPSFGFKVQGNTWLTTAPATSSEGTHVVKVIATTGNILDIKVVNDGATYNLGALDVPKYAFYNFAGFTLGGQSVSGNVTVNDDIIIRAVYNAEKADAYTISSACCATDAENGVNITTNSYAYNSLVTLEAENPANVFCWAIAEVNNYNLKGGTMHVKPISYDTSGTYSFYACESFAITDLESLTGAMIVPLSESEYLEYAEGGASVDTKDDVVYIKDEVYTADDLIIEFDPDAYEYMTDMNGVPILPTSFECTKATAGKEKFAASAVPVIDPVVYVNPAQFPIKNGSSVAKFTLVGTYIVPEGYTMIENGFIFATSSTATNLTIETVDNNGIYRYKAPKYTVGNQFVVNIVNPPFEVDYSYVAYSIIKDAEGNLVTYYSTVAEGTNNF